MMDSYRSLIVTLEKATDFMLNFIMNREYCYHCPNGMGMSCDNIGIKPGFSCIKMRQVPRRMLKAEDEARGF